MKQAKHLSMIRSFHLADWFTLGNAACGVGALFAVMSYLPVSYTHLTLPTKA